MLLVGERGGGFGFRSIAGKDRWAWVRGLVSLGRTAVREDAGRQAPGSQGPVPRVGEHLKNLSTSFICQV